MTVAHEQEVRAGQRFEFGANWASFLSVLDESRIESQQVVSWSD